MNAALFPMPGRSELGAAARAHIAALEEAGILTSAHGLHAAIVLRLADVLDTEQKGYGVAQVAKELGTALERLPSADDGDAWAIWSSLATALAAPAGPSPAPVYATPPTPGAPHELGTVQLVAALLGKPLLPWQAQVARVATERVPDGSRWRWRRVVVTVPRQAGKTTLLGAIFTARALTRQAARVWMTAQTGQDAVSRWNDLRRLVEASPLGRFTSKRLSAGSSSLTFPASDSHINPFPPTAEKLHGYTFDNAAIDEAFALSMTEGRDLIGAIEPAMITLPDHQLWVTSTAGTPDSTWLRSLVEIGRQQVNSTKAGQAYFEWSGNPDDDPANPEAFRFHPAAGWTIDLDDLMDAAANVPPSERDRAYRNLWVTAARAPLLPSSALEACQIETMTPPPNDGSIPVAIGVDVDPNGQSGSIYCAWEIDGAMYLQQLAHQDGSDWIRAQLDDIMNAAGPAAVVVVPPAGPVQALADELTRDGITIQQLSTKDWATANGSLFTRIRDGHLACIVDPELTAAIQGAATKPLGDAWTISRTRSDNPASPWCAAAAAIRYIDTTTQADTPLIDYLEGDE